MSSRRSSDRLPDGAMLWATWSAVFALAWLLPTRTPPWATFYHEALTALCFLAAAWWALLKPRFSKSLTAQPSRVDVDGSALLFLGLAAIPLLQGGLNWLVFPTESLVYASYLLAVSLAIVVAGHAQRHSPWVLVQAVLIGVVLAAMISTGLALYQRLGLSGLGLIAPDFSAIRATANLGQPNNLSTLLCLGLVGIWWGFVRRHIGPTTATLAAAFLLLGVCLTGSRTGLVALLMFPIALALGWRTLGSPMRVAAMACLAGWVACVWLGLALIPPDLFAYGGRSASEQLSSGTRPVLWSLVLDAIQQRPWAGWGWNQVLLARVELAPLYPDYKELISYSHNIVLDMMMWNGVPLGLAIVAMVVWWFGASLKRAVLAEHWMLLAALAILGTHALLELPHAYLFFLLPAAVFVGTLNGEMGSILCIRVRPWVLLAGLVAASLLLVVIVRDYQDIEEVDLSWRLHEANIGRSLALPRVAKPWILRGIADADGQLRKQAREGMPAAELQRWREALNRYPAASGLARYAQAATLNDFPQEADWALNTLCLLYSERLCTKARAEWTEWRAQLPKTVR